MSETAVKTPAELVTEWRKLARDYDTEELTDANLALRRCARQLEEALPARDVEEMLRTVLGDIATATGTIRGLTETLLAMKDNPTAGLWVEGITMAFECLTAALAHRPADLSAACGWQPPAYTVDHLIDLANAGDEGAASQLVDICEGEDEDFGDPS